MRYGGMRKSAVSSGWRADELWDKCDRCMADRLDEEMMGYHHGL